MIRVGKSWRGVVNNGLVSETYPVRLLKFTGCGCDGQTGRNFSHSNGQAIFAEIKFPTIDVGLPMAYL